MTKTKEKTPQMSMLPARSAQPVAPRGLERRTFGAKARSSNRSTVGAVINHCPRPGVKVISHLPYITGKPIYITKFILYGETITTPGVPAWAGLWPFGPLSVFFFGRFGPLYINDLLYIGKYLSNV